MQDASRQNQNDNGQQPQTLPDLDASDINAKNKAYQNKFISSSGSTMANNTGTIPGTSQATMEHVDRVIPPAQADEHIIFDETRMKDKRFGRKKNSKSSVLDKRYRKRSRH